MGSKFQQNRKAQGILPEFNPTDEQIRLKKINEEMPYIKSFANTLSKSAYHSIAIVLVAIEHDKPIERRKFEIAWQVFGGSYGRSATYLANALAREVMFLFTQKTPPMQLEEYALDVLHQYLYPYREYFIKELHAAFDKKPQSTKEYNQLENAIELTNNLLLSIKHET